MKKAWLFASVAALLVVGLPAGAGALHTPAVQAKKKCKIVIKIVHGHKRKVRVCHTVKPKPKPASVKNVSLSLDTGRAATKTIGPEGGSVTTTAADGTTLTLDLPKDAVVGATEVKVIPVKSVAGLGGHARVVGGVQIEPEGLGLFKPATLTITASSLSSKATQAFNWYGTGKTLARYPSTRSGARLQLKLAHFSGAGVAQGSSVDWSSWPSIQNALRTHYEQSTRPLMTRAETDDAVFARAMQDYLGWERTLQLLGLDDFMTQEREALAKSAAKAFRNYVQKAFERCVAQHKLEEIFTLVSGARQAALLGDEQLSNEILDKVGKCGHFELDYETIMTQTLAPPEPLTEIRRESHVRVLGLKLDLPLVAASSGEKQLEYLSWDYSGSVVFEGGSCTTSPDGVELGDPFRVVSFRFNMKLKSIAGPDGRPQYDPPTISLAVYPGKPTESVKLTCPFSEARVSENYYFGMFTDLYSAQAAGPESFLIDGWDFLGGSIYARKTYQRTKSTNVGGVPITDTEVTTYDLKHTPE